MRLRQGRYDQRTEYGDLSDWLDRLQEAAPPHAPKRLHLIDLEGARGGRFAAWTALREAAHRGFAVEVGGGLRDADSIARALDAGARYVILGTTLLEWLQHNPGGRPFWPIEHGHHLAAALDIRDGQAVVRGWATPVGPAQSWFDRLRDVGIRRVLITDVGRDGTLTGLADAEAEQFWRRWAEQGREAALTVVAGGGIRDADDLARLTQWGVPAAVVGRAWLEGRVDPFTGASPHSQRGA